MILYKHKELLLELVKREIKSKYKQSVLGYAWVLLVPLINLLVMTVVFSFFIRIPTGNVPYAIYLFAALVPWLFTLNATTLATSSVVQNSNLITKISLPGQIFPLASLCAKTIDFVLNFIIMIILMMIFGVTLKWTLIFIPLVFAVHFLLMLGISYILSSINVYFRDVENVIGVFMTMWMYLTPIFYPPEIVPNSIRVIFNLNPMTPLINSYRNIILYGVPPPWQSFAFVTLMSVIIFMLGSYIFKNLSRNFADVI